MNPLRLSLNKKVTAIVILVLGVFMIIAGFFHFRIEKSSALQLARAKVKSYAEVTQAIVLESMKEGRCKDIPVIVRAQASPEKYRIVRILDREGRIVESNTDGEKGKTLNIPYSSESAKGDSTLAISPGGERVLRLVKPLYDKTKCSRCHEEKRDLFAYLNVDITLASVEGQLKSLTKNQVLMGLGIILPMGGTLFFLISLFINKPILGVSKKMTEVENGNFDVHIPVRTQDELGHLARSFNYMVNNLKEMREREEKQRVTIMNVNENLQKKIQELDILYASTKAISQSLRIEDILRMTIANVTRSLGYDRVVLTLFDEKKKTLTGKLSIGIDEEIVRQVRIPREEIRGVLHETVQTKEPVIVKDTSAYPIIERRGVKKCWEILDCQNNTCPIHGSNELRCWMVKGTRCDREMKENTFEEKMRICGKCPYLKEIVQRSDMVNLLLFGSHSFVSVPLIAKEQVLGILLADKLLSGREISDDDMRLLTTFLSHVSVSVENALLYQKLESRVGLSEKQLEETNEQLRRNIRELNQVRSFNESILQNLDGGIVTYDKEGIITFMNKSGASLLEWEESDVLGRSVHEVLRLEGKDESLFRKMLAGNGSQSGEMKIVRKGGDSVPVEVFLSYLHDKERNITGVTGIFRDITQKREIETRLRRIDKLASLGQLASGIAHEIKNPLAGIGSAIQVLSSNIQLDNSKKEMVKEILEQIRRLDRTIKNLLSFAKPGHPDMAPTDPKEIIDNVLFLVDQQLKKQNVQVDLDLPRDLPKAMIDPRLIQQAILNVVLNAVQAMPSGGNLTLTMGERSSLDPLGKERKSYLSLTIADTGEGIPGEVLPQIFNPFYTTKTKGTGLGLSITQKIIEQHDGRIQVKSEVGKGTSFTIDLPALPLPSPHRGEEEMPKTNV